MEKVEAYRCEECKGTGVRSPKNLRELREPYPCPKCNGNCAVWLTEEEVKKSPLHDVPPEMIERAAEELKDRELIAGHEDKDSGCCGNGCGEECVG